MASVYGFDPWLYVRLRASDRLIADAVIKARSEWDSRQKRAEIEALSGAIANLTADRMTKWWKKTLKSIYGKKAPKK